MNPVRWSLLLASLGLVLAVPGAYAAAAVMVTLGPTDAMHAAHDIPVPWEEETNSPTQVNIELTTALAAQEFVCAQEAIVSINAVLQDFENDIWGGASLSPNNWVATIPVGAPGMEPVSYETRPARSDGTSTEAPNLQVSWNEGAKEFAGTVQEYTIRTTTTYNDPACAPAMPEATEGSVTLTFVLGAVPVIVPEAADCEDDPTLEGCETLEAPAPPAEAPGVGAIPLVGLLVAAVVALRRRR